MSAGPCPHKVGDKFDLGNGVDLVMTGLHGEEGVYGGILGHPAKTPTGRCEGSVHWDVPGQRIKPVWQVHSWNPLDFSPSFQCHCGFHGHIRGGKWVPA